MRSKHRISTARFCTAPLPSDNPRYSVPFRDSDSRCRTLFRSTAIVHLTYEERLNPTIKYRAHPSHMDPRMAPDVIDQYDVVLDCTDRPTSRYLISDAAVIARKPLVSASALKTEGQLLVLNWPLSTPESSEGGVCYRCVFPKPPPIESVVDCGAGGILGPVVGVMGVLMAVETMKIIVGMQSPRSPQDPSKSFSASPSPTLLLYSALSHPPFRSIRLRGKRPTCPSCSATPSITRESLVTGSTDYAFFCGITSTSTSTSTSPTYNNNGNNITPPSPKTDRISATAYAKIHHQASSPSQSHILIDVREKAHFDICHLEHSVNIPFSSLLAVIPPTQTSTSTTPLSPTTNPSPSPSLANHPALKHISHLQKYPETPVFVLCRFGNDSQVAVQKLKAWIRAGAEPNPPSTPSSPESTQAKPQITTSSSSSPHSHPHPQIQIRDISGGLASWRKEVDTEFPEY